MYNPDDVLLGYGVTASHFSRLSSSLEKQAELDHAFDLKRDLSMVMITDVAESLIPEIIKAYFSDRIVTMNPQVHDIATGRTHFSLSKMRNATINYALENKFEWLMLCDCDTVLLGTEFKNLQSNFCIPWVYWQKMPQESIVDSANFIKISNNTIFSQGNSWFILGGEVLRSVRFNENFFGYGYEDFDFCSRVGNFGCNFTQYDFVVIHNYHPPESKNIDHFCNERNKKLFLLSKILIDANEKIYNQKKIDFVHAVHPHWESDLAIIPEKNRLIHTGNKSFGDYEISDNLLTIRWDDWPAETFIRNGENFVLADQNSIAPLSNVFGQKSFRMSGGSFIHSDQTEARERSKGMESVTLYDQAFFDGQVEDSFRSARKILSFLFNFYKPNSIADFGCGLGTWLAMAADLGVSTIFGYDGDYVDRNSLRIDPLNFQSINFESSYEIEKKFDLAISLEVIEHIKSEFSDLLIDTLCRSSPVVLFGGAIPRQGGTGHVNEQWQSHWMAQFEKRDFFAIDCIRPTFWRDPDVAWWYSQNTFIYAHHTVLKNFLSLSKFFARSFDGLVDAVHPREW